MDTSSAAEAGKREQTIRARSLWSTCANVLVLSAVVIAVVGVVVGSYLVVRSQPAVSAPARGDEPPVPASVDQAGTDLQYRMAPANGWTYSNGLYSRAGTNPIQVSTTTSPPVR